MNRKKWIGRLCLSAAMSLSLSAQAATNVVWADWTSAVIGATNGSAAGVFDMPNSDISVSYAGNVVAPTQVNGGAHYWNQGSTYTSVEVPNAPTTDIIALSGGAAASVNTLTFSQAVVNPVLAIVSLGQNGAPVRYQFDNPFTIVSQGVGYWGGCSNCLSNPSGNVLVGREGHGVIQFTGTFTQISWTAPDYEYWHGFTVGVTPVPEPETYALLAAGLIGISFARRKSAMK